MLADLVVLPRGLVSPIGAALTALFVFVGAVSAQAPAVQWRRSDWLSVDPGTGDHQTREAGGEDWWYNHANSYVNNALQGFIAAGFGGSINWAPSEALSGGCLESPLHDASCEEFETTGHVKGPPVSALALINPDGTSNAWFNTYNVGVFFRVIQTRDGGYLASGTTVSTRDFAGHPIYYNPGQAQGRTTDSFDDGNGCSLSGQDVTHVVLVKTDAYGEVQWQYLYGMQPYRGMSGNPDPVAAYSGQGFGWAVTETPSGNFIVGGDTLDTRFTYVCGSETPLSRAFLIEVTPQGHWVSGTFLGSTDFPSQVEAITPYVSDSGLHYVISGNQWFEGSEPNAFTGCNLYQKVFATQLGPGPGFTTEWERTNFDFGSPESQHSSQRTDDVQIGRSGTNEILLPLVVNCTGCLYASHNFGQAKVYRLNASDGGIHGMSDLGLVTAYDLKVRVTPTLDGGFAAISSKQVNPPPSPFGCNYGTGYWNTDAYVGKFDASGGLEWETTFDVDPIPTPPAPFPGDQKKQECLYSITQDQDGGFVVSGNNSYNFDDSYMAKLGPTPPHPGPDLFVRDTPKDSGLEPNPDPGPMWVSEDIWVRNMEDGGLVHQNPVYKPEPNEFNTVYVRVTNRGDESASGVLKVYWAKASTGLSWPTQWVNYRPGSNGTLFGDQIPTTAPIVINLAPHSSIIVPLDWHVPNPEDFVSFNADRAHFCLLARIETESNSPFGMTFAEGAGVYTNTRNNNNIAWKNLTVIDGGMRPGYVMLRNIAPQQVQIKLAFGAARTTERALRTLLDYGTIDISLGHDLFSRWSVGGRVGSGFQVLGGERIRLLSPSAWIGNFQLAPGEMKTISATFNLTSLPPAPLDFHFDIVQYSSVGGQESLVGGERFSMSSAALALPDLTVLATASAASVFAGHPLLYSVVVTNAGTAPAFGATVTDILPPPLTAIWTCVGSGGAICGAVGAGNLNDSIDLPPGGTVTYTIDAIVSPSFFGLLSNTAEVAMPPGALEAELENNVSVTTTQVLPPSQVAATMVVSGSPLPGGVVTYTVVLINLGPVAQGDNPGNEFVDVLPPELTPVSGTASAGTAVLNGGTGTVAWNGSIPVGGAVTITILARIPVTVAGGTTIQNQGTVFYDSDGNGTNDASVLTDDPATGGASDPTRFLVSGGVEVPTLSPGGLLLMMIALSGLGLRRLVGRRGNLP